jgi:hypothetical protein
MAHVFGSVNLYDEGTTPIDGSNMTVTVENTNHTIAAITDMNGAFTLLDVPFGTHTIVYEKTGFGTYKLFDFQHKKSESAISNAPSLGKVSTTQITGLEANLTGDYVIISITTNPAGSNGNTRYIRYFLSTDSTVSNENYTYFSPIFASRINPKEITISKNDLINAGFASGQTIYINAYGDSFWSNEYEDPVLGRTIFPNLNTGITSSTSFIAP